MPPEHGDARELTRAGREDGVPEQPDPEGGEHWPKLGWGSGRAWSIVSRHERERASTENRLSRTPTITQRQETESNAW